MKYSSKEQARERAAEKIEVLDVEYSEVIRTRKVRREMRTLIDQHDELQESFGKTDDDAKQNDISEQLMDVRAKTIALLIGKGKPEALQHPDPVAMAEEMDGRDIDAIFFGLLGATQTSAPDPTGATTPA